jgi:predicted phage baseplate assembly protein
MPAEPSYDADGRLVQGRHELDADVRAVRPAVVLTLQFPPAETEIWEPVPHLLDSREFDRHFVVDVDNAGRAHPRFGDDEYGRRPLGAEAVIARYRVGNGRAGNLGAASLWHAVEPSPADMIDPADPAAPPPPFPGIERVRQPLAAKQGTDPETIEEVRQLAPTAFHAEQFRAVTEADYEQAALKLPGVAAAKCVFRWTGSWHTVFVALHPADPADLVTLPGGRVELAEDFANEARAHLTRYKLAGYDLALRTAQYVPLEITIEICIARGHFRGDVIAAVRNALSNRRNPDGSIGFFHPVNFAFGESVYLSRLYEAVVAVEGVDSAVVTVFERYWTIANHELDTGVIPMGPFEIARLDNDPNFPENGVLTLIALGGQ